jgi:hypothetical protein
VAVCGSCGTCTRASSAYTTHLAHAGVQGTQKGVVIANVKQPTTTRVCVGEEVTRHQLARRSSVRLASELLGALGCGCGSGVRAQVQADREGCPRSRKRAHIVATPGGERAAWWWWWWWGLVRRRSGSVLLHAREQSTASPCPCPTHVPAAGDERALALHRQLPTAQELEQL